MKSNPKHIRAMKDGKAPLEYLITSVDDGDARVLKGGADKYGVRNWLIDKILGSTYEGAIRRHFKAWSEGEDNDPDSGYHHFHHIRACCAIVLDAMKHNQLLDDRGRKESIDQETSQDTPHFQRFQLSPGQQLVFGDDFPISPMKTRDWSSMDDAHELLDTLETSDCVIAEPRDAGTQTLKCIVQYTDIDPENDTICRVIITDGPFESYKAAVSYARKNPNERLGIASICTLTSQEELSHVRK